MTKSAVRIQDKESKRKLSVVESTAVPGVYGIVVCNPDGSKIIGGGSGGATWGNITGTLSNQTDLNTALSGKESTSNKTTTINSSSTDTQYPSAKAVFDTEQDIKEIAEGKTKSYVVSDVTNPLFNSQASAISLSGSFTDVKGNVISKSSLKLGDTIFVQETDVPDRWCSVSSVTPVVPSDYTQLEYIQSDGACYIDTGIIPNYATTKIEFDGFEPTARSLFGSSASKFVATGSSGNIRFDYNGSNYLTDTAYTDRHKWCLDGNKAYIDGVLQNTFTAGTGSDTITIKLFARASGTSDVSSATCYSCKIWDNGTLVRSLVPAKNSSNVIGMYDITYEGGSVDLGTLTWTYRGDIATGEFVGQGITDKLYGMTNLYMDNSSYTLTSASDPTGLQDMQYCGHHSANNLVYIRNTNYTDATAFKQSLSGVKLYYQRTTDTSWSKPFYANDGTGTFTAGPVITEDATLYKLETAKVPVTDVQVNGTSVVSNTVANVTVPTKTSDLTNDSGYITGVAWGNITGTLSNQTDLNQELTSLDSNKSTALHDDGVPSTIPTKSGDIYTNDTTGDTYISNGSTSTANWKKVGDATWGNIGGTLSNQTDLQQELTSLDTNKSTALHDDGAPSTVPTKSGDIYTDDDTGNTYISNGTDSTSNWVQVPRSSGGSAVWGNITGTLSSQTDLQSALDNKQNTLTAGSNISISGNTISATDTKYSTGTTSTAGLTKLYTSTGTNTDGTLTQKAIRNEYVAKTSVNQELNSFNASNQYWLSSLHDLLYKADERYNVTSTGFVNTSITSIFFNGSFEDTGNYGKITSGNTGVVLIENADTTTGLFGSYASGYIYVSFYYIYAPTDISQVKVEMYSTINATGWVELINGEVISTSTSGGVNYITCCRFRNNTNYVPYHADKIRVTVDNTSGTSNIWLNEIEFFSTRTDSIKRFPVVTKYTDSEIFGNLTATKHITKNGTSSQFVKGDGSLDSNAYITSSYHDSTKQDTISDLATIRSGAALGTTSIQPDDNISELTNDAGYITSSSLPTVNDATLTIQKNGSNVATFTANSSTNQTANIVVPTKTSDITNDSGFITSSSLPTKTSDLTNDSGFITNSVSNLTNYYTKTTTDGLLADKADLSDVPSVIDNLTSTSQADALSANQGRVLNSAISGKQDTLTAGTNINISGTTISATDTTYTAGTNVQINGTTISATDTTYTASDFDIKDLADSTSLRTTWSGKQDALPTVVNDRYLHTNSSTGALEWTSVSGGGITIDSTSPQSFSTIRIGTQAQYDAITTKSSTTEYNIIE